MTTHLPDPMVAGGGCGLPRTAAGLPVVVTSHQVKAPLREIESAQFENDRQALLVFNPSPDRDSISEHIASILREGHDPVEVVGRVLPLLRELLDSNQRERGHEHAATGQLDLLHRTLHASGPRSPHGLSVLAATKRLRPALRVVKQARDARSAASRPDWWSFLQASWAIKDVVSLLPSDALRGSYLRHELGAGSHDVLLALLDGEQVRS